MGYIDIKMDSNDVYCEISHDIINIIDKKKLPLKFKVCGLVDNNNIYYETELSGGMWAKYSGIRDIRVLIFTKDNVLIKEKKYSYELENLKLYEFWEYYCKLNKNYKFLILGSGNGNWGEWCNPIIENNIKCHLVEGDEDEFKKLKNSYEKFENVRMYNIFLSSDGKDYNFYKLNNGFSSINLSYLEKNNLKTNNIQKVKTIDIKTFLSILEDIDCIRFDVEGIDYDLIKSIDDDVFNNLKFVQYEHMNLEEKKIKEIDELFINKGFKKIDFEIDTVYIKY